MIFVAIGVLEKPVGRAGSLLLPLMVQSLGVPRFGGFICLPVLLG